jgi:hypothetical protein
MPDLELQDLQRSVNLVTYARRAGYRPDARESSHSVTVLEHPPSGDRIAIACNPYGQWVYASLTNYKLRGPAEPPEHAFERLRECIERTPDKGSVVEFVQHCERVAQQRERRSEQVREHLRAWLDTERGLERDGRMPTGPGPVDQSAVQERLQRWQEAQRAIDCKIDRVNAPTAPHQERLTVKDATSVASVDKSRVPREVSRDPTGSIAPSPEKVSLGRRRYDWTPPIDSTVAKALGHAARDRGPERGR